VHEALEETGVNGLQNVGYPYHILRSPLARFRLCAASQKHMSGRELTLSHLNRRQDQRRVAPSRRSFTDLQGTQAMIADYERAERRRIAHMPARWKLRINQRLAASIRNHSFLRAFRACNPCERQDPYVHEIGKLWGLFDFIRRPCAFRMRHDAR
jgi:hypothetical protein